VRLALVSDAIYPYHMGGKEVRYRELLRRLPETDVDVTVYTMRWWSTRPPDGNPSFRAISPKLTMYRDGRRSMLQAGLFALFCLRLLWKKFDAIEADHMPYLPLFTLWFVAKARRVPLIVTWHEVWGAAYWKAYLGRTGSFAALIERVATRIPTLIVAVSQGTAAGLESMGVNPKRVVTIPGGVDATRLAAIAPADDAPDLLSVGRLIDHKRVDVTIDVAARLIATGRQITLGVIGEGPDSEILKTRVNDLGIADSVTFYGSIADTDEMLSLIRGARVLLYPTEREGFGLVAAEALGLGTPVVTTTCEANEARRLIEPSITGSLVEKGDVAGFTAAVEWWLDQPSEIDVSAEFFATHPEVDWSNMATSYQRALARIVDGRG
jgi:glycosyltransferase involved in cell wall biosynthesis